MRKIFIGALCLFIGVALFFLGRAVFLFEQSSLQNNDDRLVVVALFFPLAEVARAVGGDAVSVVQLVPDGVEVHEYEPTPQDIATLLSADVVLLLGAGIDAWADDVLVDASSAPVVVRMSDVVPFAEREGNVDPHAWLDPMRVKELSMWFARELIVQDPVHASLFSERAGVFADMLTVLDADFSQTLASCARTDVLVAHDAFYYWHLRYGLTFHTLSGISPESEPSLRDFAALTQTVRDLGITTIFFEDVASTMLADTLAAEVGVSSQVLYPLEGRTSEHIAAGATYEMLMREDLAALTRALVCQK